MNKAIFLDRDGTVIEEKKYLSEPKQVKILPHVIRGMNLLKNNGFKLILTTNQSGINRKYFTRAKLEKVHIKIKKLRLPHGIKFDAVYFCPHRPDEKCGCRKPETGMAEKARTRFGLSLKKSYSIGDKLTDIKLAHNFSGKGVLVLTGYGKNEIKNIKTLKIVPEHIAKNLYETAKWIIADYTGNNN